MFNRTHISRGTPRHALLLLGGALVSMGLIVATLAYTQGVGAQSIVQASLPNIWQKETWTKGDAVFKVYLRKFRKQIASGEKASDLALHLRPNAEANAATGRPENAEAVFRFGYAAYVASKLEHDDKFLADADDDMNRVLPSHSYQFTRLHFLLDRRSGNLVGLRDVGLRLLKHDPTDYDVKYYFVGTLNPGRSAEDRRLALTYTTQLIHQFPKSPKGYALLGYVYDIANAQNHDPRDGDMAIAAYQHYLKIAPLNDSFHEAALSHIQSVRMLQQSQKAKRGAKKS